MRESFREQSMETKEGEKKPQIELWITRHGNRAPSGELLPEGIAAAQAKGEDMDAEVIKGYSSTEKSDRAYKTLQEISEASGIKDCLKFLKKTNFNSIRFEDLFG